MADYLERAAKCRELAASSKDEKGREYWKRMEAFWLDRARQIKEQPLDSPPTDIVKV